MRCSVVHLAAATLFCSLVHGWAFPASRKSLGRRQNDPQRFIFAFGDSYTSMGFDLEGEMPSNDNPFGNPEWPGKTLTAGPTWIGALVKYMAPKNTLAYNFARAGAVVNRTRYPNEQVKCFIEQVDDFFHIGLAARPRPSHAKWDATNSVFVSWFGINDIGLIRDKSVKSEAEAWRIVLDDYFAQIDRYFFVGARNFIVMGIPPFERTPKYQDPTDSLADADWVAQSVEQYNTMTVSHVNNFRRWHPEVTMHYIDTGAIMTNLLDHYEDYDAPDANCTMFQDLRCFWANGLHAGPKLQRAVGQRVFDTLDWDGFWGSVWLNK